MKRKRPAKDDFGVERIRRGKVQIVAVRGYVGNRECLEMERALEDLLGRRCRRLSLDLASLTFVTDPNLARIVALQKQFHEAGGELKLAGLTPSLEQRVARAQGLGKSPRPEAESSEGEFPPRRSGPGEPLPKLARRGVITPGEAFLGSARPADTAPAPSKNGSRKS